MNNRCIISKCCDAHLEGQRLTCQRRNAWAAGWGLEGGCAVWSCGWRSAYSDSSHRSSGSPHPASPPARQQATMVTSPETSSRSPYGCHFHQSHHIVTFLKLQPKSGYKRDVAHQQKPVEGTSHPCYIWLQVKTTFRNSVTHSIRFLWPWMLSSSS